MSFGNTTENDVCLLIFNATALSWNANTNLFLALHSSDPGETGNQTTNEISYGGYARVTVARSGSGFTVTGNQAVNAALAQFPACTSGTATATHVSIGTASSGTGQIIAKGALTSSLSISSGIQPQFAASALTFTLD